MDLLLVNPNPNRVTRAMKEALKVMDFSGGIVSAKEIARRRWPDHPCWEPESTVRPNQVIGGLARTLERLDILFGVYPIRFRNYVITRQGCAMIGQSPRFTHNDHIGDHLEVLLDALYDKPTTKEGFIAFECLHYWATERGADFTPRDRAKSIAARAVDVLCHCPYVRRKGHSSTAAARTIFDLTDSLTRTTSSKEKYEWLLPGLVKLYKEKRSKGQRSWSAGVMIGRSIEMFERQPISTVRRRAQWGKNWMLPRLES